MKKLLLGLGSIAAVAAPIVAVVSCGNKDADKLETAKKDAIAKLNKRFKEKHLTNAEMKLINDSKDIDEVTEAYLKIIENRTPVAAVNGKLTRTSVTALGSVTLAGTDKVLTLTVLKGVTITTDEVKALYSGMGTITVTGHYDSAMVGIYTFTVTDSGMAATGGGTGTPSADSATVVVTVTTLASQAKTFMDKVLGTLATVEADDANSTEVKAYATKVLAEFNAGIAANGIVTGKATGDATTAPTSNNNYDHTKSLVRVLDNEDQKLSFSFNMSIAKSGELFKSADSSNIVLFKTALEKELKAIDANLNNVGAGFYKSTQRINGVAINLQLGTAANPNHGPDDYFRFTFNIAKANIVSTTGITATHDGTVASYSDLFKGLTIDAAVVGTSIASTATLASIQASFGLGATPLSDDEMNFLRGATVTQILTKTSSPDDAHKGSSSTGTKMYVLKGKALLGAKPVLNWLMSQGLSKTYGGEVVSQEATALLFVDKNGKVEFFRLFKDSNNLLSASSTATFVKDFV